MADALTSLLSAIAERAATVDGIEAGYYPAPNSLQRASLPAVVVFSGSPVGESTIAQNTGGARLWTPAVLVQILGPRVGNTPQEFARIDRLIVPVVDAFDAPLSVTVDGRTQHIDRCTVTGYRGSLTVNYAGIDHYGAEIYLSIKFRRPAGG